MCYYKPKPVVLSGYQNVISAAPLSILFYIVLDGIMPQTKDHLTILESIKKPMPLPRQEIRQEPHRHHKIHVRGVHRHRKIEEICDIANGVNKKY
jgi:hypothetical protein